MIPVFSNEHIIKLVSEEIPCWSFRDKEIHRDFSFPSFQLSIDFINHIAKLAEERNHHPHIIIHFTYVQISLSTHDAGGITEKDFVLAKEIDNLLKK